MIVDENDCRRSFGDRFPENFPRMHERRIEKPAGYRNVPLQPVLGVEYCDVKFFDRQIFEPLREDLEHIARPPHRRAFLPFFSRHPSSQLEGGVDTNSTSRSYAPNAGEGGDGLSGEEPKRAPAPRKYLLPDAERRSTLGAAT